MKNVVIRGYLIDGWGQFMSLSAMIIQIIHTKRVNKGLLEP